MLGSRADDADATTTDTEALIDGHELSNDRDQQRRSLIRRILSSRYTPSLAAEIASLLNLSPRSTLRTSLSNSFRSLVLTSSLSSIAQLSGRSPIWRSLRTRKENCPSQNLIAHIPAITWTLRDEQELNANRKANAALLAQCCGVLPSPARCIHQQLNDATDAGTFVNVPVVESLFAAEIVTTDLLGNCLLHVAARWAVDMTTIARLVQRLPIGWNVTILNRDSETFLHVLNPTSITSADDFAALLHVLRTKKFDFCQRDCEGRTFVTRLVTRSGLPWKALVCLLETATREELRCWAMPQMTENLAWNELLCQIFDKLARETGHALGLVLHSQHLLHRCLMPEDDSMVAFTIRPGGISTTVYYGYRFVINRAWTLASLVTTLNWEHGWDMVWGESQKVPLDDIQTMKFDSALEFAIECGVPVDLPDTYTGQTPLMLLLTGFSCAMQQPQDAAVKLSDSLEERCVKLLLDAGASLDQVDKQGNSPVHYAAALGLSTSLKIFVHRGGSVSLQNSHGLTPAQVAAASMKYGKLSNLLSTSRTARLYESVSILTR